MDDKQVPPTNAITLPATLFSTTDHNGDGPCQSSKESLGEAHRVQPVGDMVRAPPPAPETLASSGPMAPQKHMFKGRAQRARRNLLDLPNDILEIIIKDVSGFIAPRGSHRK